MLLLYGAPLSARVTLPFFSGQVAAWAVLNLLIAGGLAILRGLAQRKYPKTSDSDRSGDRGKAAAVAMHCAGKVWAVSPRSGTLAPSPQVR